MSSRSNRDIFFCYVNADAQALCIYIREMLLCFFGILVSYIQANVVERVDFHLVVYGASNNVARCKTKTLIIFVHKFLAIWQAENTAISAHSLGNKVCRMSFGRVEERSWMELHKLHILNRSLGTINHGYTIARCNVRVCCG